MPSAVAVVLGQALLESWPCDVAAPFELACFGMHARCSLHAVTEGDVKLPPRRFGQPSHASKDQC